MRDYLHDESATAFIFPIDGDVLTPADGEMDGDGIVITVSVRSSSGASVKICDIDAEEDSGIYRAGVRVPLGHSLLTVKNENDGSEDRVEIYCSQNTERKYRISSDDNILFLADITYSKDKYTSIFDNPYLAVYKEAHDRFGACIHLNLFYRFDRAACKLFSEKRPDFDLSMMTDKFKQEWKKNSDWLKLSFHARSEFPDKPYKYADAETIVKDYLDVRREVIRFAGEEAFSDEVTTIHWGEANIECVRALKNYGLHALTGYFELDEEGEPLVSYYAPISLTKHVGERDFWQDREVGITFGRIDRVTNIGTLDEIMSDMKNIIRHPTRGGFVSLMIHEQYFHSDYENYLPDFKMRVLAPAELLYKNGYKGTLISEVLEKNFN